MMHAYDADDLYKAQMSLGWMFEYAVNTYGMDIREFYQMFLQSPLSSLFAEGDSRVLMGMSGTEMAMEIISGSKDIELPEPVFNVSRSPEYWVGWSLAYYQWYRNESFNTINEDVDITDILRMYKVYHEVDITHFVEDLDDIRKRARNESMLKRIRKYAGISQKELSDITGIPLKTIQQYEQRQKNINHARADNIIRLSKALKCEPEMLMELE